METSDIFDRMAGRYDTEDRVNIANIIVRAIRAGLTDTRGKTALDYGCGTGLVGFGLIDLFRSMLFVDASPPMIEQVKRKIENGQFEAASTFCGDFQLETPRAWQVDYVIMAQALLHIKDSRFILSRLYDILKKDGHLIVVDFDQNELIRLLKQVGFAAVDAHTFYHGPKLLMNRDASLFILNAQK
jgi:ubiquinone/menaquinone biosynthesis C-methylase UbiE